MLALACWFFSSAVAASENYGDHPRARALIEELATEHNFDSADLTRIFGQAQKKQAILDAIARPAEKTKPWKDYRAIFLTPSRIDKGVQFWRDNRAVLERAHDSYGVPPEIVVAIIGVETRYGRNTGSYRVIDALSTLAFDYPKRSPFFTRELKHFLLLTREQQQDPLALKGSYAGAMGYGQFMPSSYRAYAVDFDNDKFVDIWSNTTDAIGSVANYFKRHGWQSDAAVVARARISGDYDREPVNQSLKPTHTVQQLAQLGFSSTVEHDPEQPATIMKLQGEHGAEFWIGLKNFYVITRYNRSRLYAMAVYQLSEAIRVKAQTEKVAAIIE
ncbi:lytic murein transglycosylase B [Exilibacterium tricleocarpae]|uniref:Lytic murein transglycosylase B n=2 Tax=Exilibacterium tricleocarpae TaxID=2591008 RepID=A0A545STL7_9GAMM|nr:lytic murein transglycosylase B [Exilibacterium tricleocarpae]